MGGLGPGLCSIAGDPPFNNIFKGPAYFLHRVKGENICAILAMRTSSILSSGMLRRTKIEKLAHFKLSLFFLICISELKLMKGKVSQTLDL